MSRRRLLCTDLDRTLLPNGDAPESPGAREAFARVAAQDGLRLAYVTGRHLALMEEAVVAWGLPEPDFAVTDVGTRIWARAGGRWSERRDWAEAIAADWAGRDHGALAALFDDLAVLHLQPDDRQAPHKLSYFVPLETGVAALRDEMTGRLEARGVRAAWVWSVDEIENVGLLDILPAGATKRHAVEFLAGDLGLGLADTLFAGDSGNDLEVLVSPVPAVLVANASDEVRRAAVHGAEHAGASERLHLARGGLAGMNGNYAAGILEGVAHFWPGFFEQASIGREENTA